MATLTVPSSIDPTGTTEVWSQLAAFLSTVRTGDVVQAPNVPTYRCDQPLQFPHKGVKFFWNGASFRQTNARPFGATCNDGVITGGVHLSTATQLPSTCNWGYVTGPGIPPGTQLIFDSGTRKRATLSQDCVDGTGLPLVFTSKQDRNRCGFNITGTDIEQHDYTWFGPDPNPVFSRYLEAQHGTNFAGATNVSVDGGSAKNMYGDGIYFGAAGTRITMWVSATNGTIDNCARSGVTPINSADCSVSKYVIDNVGRTVVNVEPPDAGCKLDRFKLTDSIIGSHQLTLLSSGGDIGAHVGAIELSRNTINKTPMVLWLIKGDGQHQRGPYTIAANTSTVTFGYGASYPTTALICLDHARGATIVDNKGIILQDGRGMAVVRSQHATGPIVVHGNDHAGGIEVGPWV